MLRAATTSVCISCQPTTRENSLFENRTATFPEINALYLLMQPAYVQFTDAYSKVTQDFNAYKVATSDFEVLIKALSSTHIHTWDIAIRVPQIVS